MTPINELRLINETTLEAGGARYACRIGRAGIAAPGEKREGDLKTPSGSFPLRCCYYRPDRIAPPPTTLLPLIALTPEDGWCDDPAHPAYNRLVKRPFSARHEVLWREDGVYDLIIPLGYNDDPPIAGLGSAIFLHLTRPDGIGTEGCVAIPCADLLALLPRLDMTNRLIINLPG